MITKDALLAASQVSVPSEENEITSGQKWWAAIVLGLIFAIISSPPLYLVTTTLTEKAGGTSLSGRNGPTIPGLILHTVIFILIIRLILW